ncbi:RagB/SusD family nutrient uptake outer membrane protein [Pedobacter sp. BS3]|uniref:RagB/SusD family nutrient uptake outer membrane protein n=1 Tax=Pedobacter sp. BS3 TaxID=2567937 RepID=UPI0011ED48B9|nr:RagB/SusD family nutrient uptake outer membrane protein [Pedobacter sp. BS3]TZF81002.1 RagB/SusD family nutrient uptake outer membrane protein [Pedobacter sp. BS3]
MKLHKKLATGIFTITLLAGCSKDALKIDAPGTLLADNLYTNKAGFNAGINGLYNEVRRSRSGIDYGSPNSMMLGPAFIGVDNAYGNYASVLEDIFNKFGANNNSSQPQFSKEWAWLYETINAANTIIHRAENPGIDWTEAQKNEILANARFIRAWCYRHLTYLWGDVPLTLEESSGENIREDWPRNSVAEVRKAMEDDWLFAEQYLPEEPSNAGEMTKGAAQHYLAELYLAEGLNEKARDYALKVTTNAKYKLVTARFGANASQPGTPFTDMFIGDNANRSAGNTEALWVLQNELNVAGGEGDNLMRRYWVNRYYSFTMKGTDGKSTSPFLVSADFGGRGIGRFGPTLYAISLYDAGDDRGSDYAWRFSYTINNPNGVPAGYHLGDVVALNRTSIEKNSNANWPSTRKWDYTSPIDVNVDRQYNDQMYIRSAETYLILAEAYLKLGRTDLASDAINALRNRAHAPTVNASQITLDFILDERSRELFSEEERRYTLLRTHTWLTRVKQYNHIAGPVVTARDTLLPIPQDVIDANRVTPMPQNKDY